MPISTRRFLLISGSLLLASLACNIGGSTPAPTATLVSNQPLSTPQALASLPAPVPTSAQATAEPPTATPQPSYDPATASLSDLPYTHPNGLFELLPPAFWTVEQDDSGVSFRDPAGIGYLQVQMTNSGYQLDGPGFEQFVRAREANLFGGYPNYQAADQQVEAGDGLASQSKTFVQEGQLQAVVSFYDQQGPVIFSVDFWETADQAGTYRGLYDEFYNHIQADSQAAFALPPYGRRYAYTDSQNQYKMEVPESWQHKPPEEAAPGLEQFEAPDGRAEVSALVYPAAPAYNPPIFVQDLLRTYLGLEIQVTGEQSLAGGWTQYTWASSDGGRTGVALLVSDTLPTLLVTGSTDVAYQQIYGNVLESILTSVARP